MSTFTFEIPQIIIDLAHKYNLTEVLVTSLTCEQYLPMSRKVMDIKHSYDFCGVEYAELDVLLEWLGVLTRMNFVEKAASNISEARKRVEEKKVREEAWEKQKKENEKRREEAKARFKTGSENFWANFKIGDKAPETAYTILGVSRGCTKEEAKQAYRKLAMQHHPDLGGDTATMQKINAAWDELKGVLV